MVCCFKILAYDNGEVWMKRGQIYMTAFAVEDAWIFFMVFFRKGGGKGGDASFTL